MSPLMDSRQYIHYLTILAGGRNGIEGLNQTISMTDGCFFGIRGHRRVHTEGLFTFFLLLPAPTLQWKLNDIHSTNILV